MAPLNTYGLTPDDEDVRMTINDLPWKPISAAPHDRWLLLRGPSGRRDGLKRYIVARFESERPGDWCGRFRDLNNDRVTDSGVMPSEYVEIE